MPLPPDLEREQRRFQQKIDSIDQEDDPLDIYYSYARWLEDNYQPQEANDSGLIDLLEQATQQLGGDPIAKNDLRCLKLWIMYAKYVEDSASVFNHVYTNNIGTKYALLYEEYAELLERTGYIRQADELYRHGIYRKARPVDRLKAKYEQFQQRNPSKNISNPGHNRYAPMLARPDPGRRPEKLRLDFGLLFKDGVEYSVQEARARSMGLLGKKWPPPAPTDLDLKRSGQSRVKFSDDGAGRTHTRRGLMPPPEPTVTLATKEALADVFGMYNSPDRTSKFGTLGSKHAPVHTVKIVPRTLSQTHVRDLGEAAVKQPAFRPFVDENPKTPKIQPFIDPPTQKPSAQKPQPLVDENARAALTPKFQVFVDSAAPRTDPKTPALQSNENAGVPFRPPKPPPVFSENPTRPNVFSRVFTPAPADGKRPPKPKSAFTPLRDPIGPTFKVFSRPGTQPENTPKPIFYPFVDKSKRSENEVRRKSAGKQVTIVSHEESEEEEEQRGDGGAGNDADSDRARTPDEDHTDDASHHGRYGKQIDVMTPITERTFEVTTTTTLRPHDANDATSAALELAAELRADEESDADRDERGLRYDTAFSPQYSDSQDDEDEDHSYRFITDDPVHQHHVDETKGHNHRFATDDPAHQHQVDEIEERTSTLSLKDAIAAASSFRPRNPCVPFDGPVISALLSLAPHDSTFHDFRNEDKDHLAALQKFCKKRERDGSDGVFVLDIGGNVYEVMERLGEGGFGAVFAAADIKRQLELQEEVFVAVKVVRPKNLWEFHVLKSLRASLPPHLRVSIIEPQVLYVFRDESYLILDMCTQGTLLELVNRAQEINVAEKGACLRESLVMFFTIELLRLVEGMHAAGFIHGDLKIDNCLLRLGDAPLSSTYDPTGAGGWSDKGIKLIDFGRTIDTRQFPADQLFLADWPTDAKDCPEMRGGLPWTYQPDYFGLAGIIYCMLYGKYFEDNSIVSHPGEDGKPRYKLAASFKRYWQVDLWAKLFDLLLNSTLVQEGGSLPLCSELGALREEMEEVLVAKDRSHGSALPLKALLGKIIIASDER